MAWYSKSAAIRRSSAEAFAVVRHAPRAMQMNYIENYIVLTGDPEFKVGADSDFELKNSGEVVLHHSDISHSIRSSDEPFYAIFGWRGDINARSWYRNDMTDANEPKKHAKIKES